MRNLALSLTLWLIARLNLPVIVNTRINNGTDAVARGARWEAFYHEQGGLADMLAGLRREAFEAAAELDPRETDLIYYWATADRNIRKLQGRVETVVAQGKIEAANIKAKESAAAMNFRKSV